MELICKWITINRSTCKLRFNKKQQGWLRLFIKNVLVVYLSVAMFVDNLLQHKSNIKQDGFLINPNGILGTERYLNINPKNE